MHACRFHVDNDILHTFHIPTATFYSTYSIQKDRYQRIQRRQAVFLFSLIFLNCCKPRSFYFSMLRLWLTLFPLFF